MGVTLVEATSAQEPALHFQRLDAEDGLSQASVTSIAQDTLGFIWLGTQDGLNRYDGYDFEVFRDGPGGLTNTYVNDLLVDRAGTLWVATYDGLDRYVYRTDSFRPYRSGNGGEEVLAGKTVRSLHEDREGVLWVGTTTGLYRLDPRSGELRSYLVGAPDPERDVRSVTDDARGRIWVATNGGLGILDPGGDGVKRFVPDGADTPLLADDFVWELYTDPGGDIWIGTAARGLIRVDPVRDRVVRRYPGGTGSAGGLSHPDVRAVHRDRRGALWVGTFDGLNVLDPSTGTFTTHRHRDEHPLSLSQSSIWAVHEDDEGLLWFGTMIGGVSIFDPRTRAFAHYRAMPDDPRSLSNEVVYAILRDSRGDLWVGTRDGGLNRRDGDGDGFTALRGVPGEPGSLNSDYVLALAEGADGDLWIGHHDHGVNRLDPETGSLTRYRHRPGDEGSLASDWIRALAVDDDGYVWIGTSGRGLDRLDPETGAVTHHRSVPDDSATLSSDYIRSLTLGSGGDLWVGTYGNGANRLDPETGRVTRFTRDPDDPSSIGSDYVRSIFEDSRGRFWFATDDGVDRLNPNSREFVHYGRDRGLPDDVVYGILEDDDGRLWMSTNRGLVRFDPDSGEVRRFDDGDGLQGQEFNTGAFYRDLEGRMYFGGVNGLSVFHPDEVRLNDRPPPVVLTDFLLFNEPVPIADSTPTPARITHLDRVAVDHTDRLLTLEFSALSYRQPEENRYAYRLEGFQDTWIRTSSRNRRATFTAVPPGEYTFRVRAANEDGVWNEEGVALRLSVMPAFWQTTLFKVGIGLLLLGAVAGAVFWRYRDLQRRNVVLEQTVRERTRELEENLERLQASSRHIQKLEGLLPICSGCKRIRHGEGTGKEEQDWVEIESYIRDQTEATFSHGVCPDCRDELYPGL